MTRLRGRAADEAPSGLRLAQAGRPPAFVGQVVADPALPTIAGRFIRVQPMAVLGAEAEAQPGSLAPSGAGVMVYVVGSKAPVAGDSLVCRFVNDRWIAERSAGPAAAGVVLPGCSCTSLPATIHMTSANPSCAGGMFPSCTIVYGPTPAAYAALNLGAQCYLSTATFLDPLGQSFCYYLTCQGAWVLLARAYAQSIYGSPYLDVVRYSWSLTAPSNTCSPLLLVEGQIYNGGDPTCSVTLSA